MSRKNEKSPVILSDKQSANLLMFLVDIVDEYELAREKFNEFASLHEGYAVLLEEVEEVWEEVKHPTGYTNLRKELVQVAAMSLAMVIEAQGVK